MTISESLLEAGKTGVEREAYPAEIGTMRKRHADWKHAASTRSTARYDNDAENGDRKYYMWSTPAAFAFFSMLIVLTLLFSKFLELIIDFG